MPKIIVSAGWKPRVALAAVAAVGFAFGGVSSFGGTISTTAHAFGEAPQPVVDCRKRKNRAKPECTKPKASDEATGETKQSDNAIPLLDDDQIYATAYGLAQTGNYSKARDVLLTAKDGGAPRILNYLGFTTRKLGQPEAALVYYERALIARPDYAVARSYYGEALADIGRTADARTQLALIEKICGVTCEAYVRLSDRLSRAAG
ncbi:MAG: tetratricopeptide repeat protein [Pseudomonadota bacterium]